MKIYVGPAPRNCDGLTRRRMLRVGSSGLISGLTLPRLLQLEAQAGTAETAPARACIFLFLEGGPSTIDMWDLKPEAPAEIRGPFQPIASSVPGTFVGEHCPLSAKIADKFTILRSHSHNDNGHNTGYHYVMTGYRADFADGESRVPNNVLYPSIGSVVAREKGPRGALPPYMNLPHPMTAGGAGNKTSTPSCAGIVRPARRRCASPRTTTLKPKPSPSKSRKSCRRRRASRTRTRW